MLSPYPVSGYIYESDGSTALENAVVTARNVRTGEFLSLKSVSNSAGEYIIDLANFSSGYNNGDLVRIYAYEPSGYFYLGNTTINATTGLEERNLTSETFTYTTPEKVASRLQLSKGFGMDAVPTAADVAHGINDIEYHIETVTKHAWRELTESNEYHSFSNIYIVDTGRSIFLMHRKVKAFDASEGDKMEIWDGGSWVEWIGVKSESRNGDYWVNYEEGVIFLRMPYIISGKEIEARITYRYGDSTVPGDIENACCGLVAAELLTGEDRSVILPAGEASNMGYADKIRGWKRTAEETLSRKAEFIPAGW